MSLAYKIPFGTDQHTQVRQAIRNRYDLSRREMEKYYERWKDNEERFIAYRPETEENASRDVDREDGEPQFTTLEIPYSYAMLMTAHTYWTTVFLSRSPIFQYTARHGGPKENTMAVEALIDYQVSIGEMLVPLFIWLLDKGKYGLGVLCDYWHEEEVVVSNIEERPKTYLGQPIEGEFERIRNSKRIKGYQGNKLFNVKPYNWFPDPRVPIKDFQNGDFCGRNVELSWNDIIRGEAQGRYFNIDALKKVMKSRQNQDTEEYATDQVELPALNEFADMFDRGFSTCLEMFIELIPNDWNLGKSKYPEKWVFTLAGDQVIIEARPYGAYHGKFPFQVQEYEIDGYALIPRSMLEILEPLNNTMTWLVNTHFHSVRKNLNGELIYDPSRIVGKDLRNPTSGRLIRLKPEAYGTNAAEAVHQLQFVDVTAQHLKDAQIVGEMMQRTVGVTDNVMGMLQQGGRRTASETRISSSFSTNRLKTNAEYDGAMGWFPLGQMMLQNTQQYYDNDQQFKIAGDLLTERGMIQVTPDMIQGFFDYVPVDGTLPIDRFAMANLWRELMAQMAKIPQILATYDIGSIFAYTAKLAGATNIDQFKINIRPDEEMQRQAAAGNLVPIGGGNGGGNGRAAASETPTVSEPGQVSGLGRTG